MLPYEDTMVISAAGSLVSLLFFVLVVILLKHTRDKSKRVLLSLWLGYETMNLSMVVLPFAGDGLNFAQSFSKFYNLSFDVVIFVQVVLFVTLWFWAGATIWKVIYHENYERSYFHARLTKKS